MSLHIRFGYIINFCKTLSLVADMLHPHITHYFLPGAFPPIILKISFPSHRRVSGAFRFHLAVNPNTSENLTLLPRSISRLSSLFSSSFQPGDSTAALFPDNTYIFGVTRSCQRPSLSPSNPITCINPRRKCLSEGKTWKREGCQPTQRPNNTLVAQARYV